MGQSPEPGSSRSKANLWLVGVAVGVLALAIAGVVVALVTSRDEDLLSASSPEGVVQRYLAALEDRRYTDAFAYLNASTKRQCTLDEFVRATSYRQLEDSEMVLDDTQVLDGTAIVTARVTVFDPGNVFDSSDYSYTETFELTREGSQWRMDWEDYRCPPLF
jgi:hypothetical protein